MSDEASNSFIFYESFLRAVERMPEDNRLDLLMVILRYGLYGEEPGDDSGVAGVVFELIRPNIDANAQRRVNGAKGGQYGYLGGRPKKNPEKPHRGYDQNPIGVTPKTPNVDGDVDVDVNEDVDVDANVNVESVAQKPKRTRFVPPTLEEVAAYSIEKGLGLDCERFVDFYAAKGWRVGSTPMKDWKAAARNWARQDKERKASAPAQPKRFSNFQEHGNDGAPSDLAMELFRRQQQLGGGRGGK